MATAFNYFKPTNRFTRDDVGNIGITDSKGLFNSNEVGTNTDTISILKVEQNKQYFINNTDTYDIYFFANNVIVINGQKIPKFSLKNS